MRLHACVLAAAAIVGWQGPAAGAVPSGAEDTNGDPTIARAQLKIGYELAEAGKCDEAVPHLRESLRLDPRAITLINLADCEEGLGRLSVAMTHWVDARTRARAEGARAIESEAEKRAAALEPRLARLTIVLAPSVPSDALIERDGVVLGAPSIGIPLPMNPGAHALVVKVKGRADRVVNLTLAEGEARRVELDAATAFAPSPGASSAGSAGRSIGPLGYAGFGLAVAGVAAGTVTGLMALGAASEAEAACPGLACDRAALDDVETGRALGTVATISFAAAGVGALVGVVDLVWGAKPARDAHAARMGLAVTPTGVRVGGRF